MAGFKLAPTTFSTSVDEKLATVDAYALTSALVVNNNLPDVNDTTNLDGFKGLKGASPGAGLQLFKPTGGIGLKVNSDSLLKSITSANSALQTALSKMPNGIKSALLKASGKSEILGTIAGITSTIKGADLTTLTGLGSLIGSVAGSNYPILFNDKSGLIALSGNIIKQASEIGLPNVLKAFTDGITDKGILSGIAKEIMPHIVSTSNVNMLSNLASSSLAKDVLKNQPNFISDFTKNFKLPANLKQSQYSNYTDSIKSSFFAINPNWNKTILQTGLSVLNMSITRDSSPEFKRLLRAKANINHVTINPAEATTINTSVALDELSKASAMDDFMSLDKNFATTQSAKPQACLARDFPYNVAAGLDANEIVVQ